MPTWNKLTPEGRPAKKPRVEGQMVHKNLNLPSSSQADISTFAFAPSNGADKSFLRSRMDIVTPLNQADALKKSTYNPETIARDVLIATGRHPTEKSLNYHLVRLRDAFPQVKFSSDLSTFRWDLVDSNERATEPRDTTARSSNATAGAIPRPQPEPSVPTTNTIPAAITTPAITTPAITTPAIATPAITTPAITTPAITTPAINAFTAVNTINGKTPSPATKPAQAPLPQLKSPVQQETRLNSPKPISLPRQQSPAHSSNPVVHPKMVGKRPPGRPPKNSKIQQQKTTISVEPPLKYLIYRCGWENCQAELHNLEMLKKHTSKVHIPHTITCQWKGCSFSKSLPSAQLLKHVRKEHIEPIAWELGDGPSVPTTMDDSSSKPSVPVTIPDINQQGGEDSLIFPASSTSIRAYNRVHGNHSQHEKAMGILKAVQRQKEHIGFGLDPGGCQLATPARNTRVSNEQDVYDVSPEL
ncbi:hypothetical protein FE257_002743 [Aspergillus nanangensis]|uniref:C2H2-type domain-containing protein n=1 Tax=Aspergillus nanangensis TaxID=2582783 RepID=A0AAD4CCN2_ASPNN|nr:hypothetical protein FE257_002743 [Aspergillus nanangensis]